MSLHILVINNQLKPIVSVHETRNDALSKLSDYIEILTPEQATVSFNLAQQHRFYWIFERTVEPSSSILWDWQYRLDLIDYDILKEFIADEINQGNSDISLMVKLYDRSTMEQRDIIDSVLDALTDRTLPELLERSQ